MGKKRIRISGYASISALGHQREGIYEAYRSGKVKFWEREGVPVIPLPLESSEILESLKAENKLFRGIDRTVLMAIYAARYAVADAGWTDEKDISINIGSSRGASALFEEYIARFNASGTVPPNTSPVTTLGNISSFVGQDLNSTGCSLSHSVTCSTGLQAIANAVAWLKSGMAEKFLAGASEAPLTPFTIAQMKALGIYSNDIANPYPCRPFNANKKNTFVLGEGAAIFALESTDEKPADKPAIFIESVGLGFESIGSKTSVSREGKNFQQAMENAIKNAESDAPVDLIILHAPGTVVGDYAELNAVNHVFGGSTVPPISSSKWMTGHTLGASGCMALDYALYILQTQKILDFPYATSLSTGISNKPVKRIMVTAAGFGGNAAAIIVSRGN